MGDAKVRTMDVASPTETIATSRKSGWFQFTDLDKKALIRRINARYNSGKDITIKLYANGDSSNSIFSGTLRANDGPTNPAMTVNTNSETITDTTATTLKTNGTNILKTGDWIKIGNEIMKIVEAAFEHQEEVQFLIQFKGGCVVQQRQIILTIPHFIMLITQTIH